MTITTSALLGVCAGVLNLFAFIPYIRSIRSGKTKPERSCWWIWTLLIIGAFAAQAAAGARWSLLLTGTLLIGNASIAWLSLRHGYGHFKLRDFLSLVLAVIGVGLWKVTRNPLAALVIIIAVDFLGNWLTLTKSWRAPYSENLSSWILMGLAGIAGALSVGSGNITALIFPLYLIAANSLTAVEIVYRRSWKQ